MKAPPKKKQPRVANQRLSTWRQRRQQHLLDVRVRSRRASHHRNWRILILLSKTALGIAFCAGSYYGIRQGLSHFFFDNPDYRLSTIAVQTDGTLQRDQILKSAQLSEGLNIFSVNLARVRDQLQQLAQVDEAQVERKMPNEIDIHITERKPIAWITSEKAISDPFVSDAAFLVDARGILMKEKKLLPEYLALPLITGCSSEALVPGKTIDSFEAKAALELLRLTTTSFMQTRFQIREVDVSKGYCLLVTDKNHTQVMFGFENLATQMQRLEQFLIYSDDSHREIETVDLLVARNIPVTFTKPAAAIISELGEETDLPSPAEEAKTATAKTVAREPQIRRAKPVSSAAKKPASASPGVKQYHSSPSPVPVRKAIPLQRLNQENNPNG